MPIKSKRHSPVLAKTRSPTKGHRSGQLLPNRSDLLAYTRPVIDSIGESTRTIYPLQTMTGGTITGIPGGVTVVSNGGTGSVELAAGTITITGVVSDILLSDGSLLVFGNETLGIVWNTNGVNYPIVGVTCGTDLEVGSDYLNQSGWLLAPDDTYFLGQYLTVPIPENTVIPAGVQLWSRA